MFSFKLFANAGQDTATKINADFKHIHTYILPYADLPDIQQATTQP
jgi:hypothetical protein